MPSFDASMMDISVNIQELTPRETDIVQEAVRAAAQQAIETLIGNRAEGLPPGAASTLSERMRQKRIDRQESAERAKRLLLECLSEKQRLSYMLFDSFTVKARGLFGRKYRLSFRDSVMLLDRSGATAKRYCVQLNQDGDDFPEWDRLLAIKMMIETDEKLFLKIAIPVTSPQ